MCCARLLSILILILYISKPSSGRQISPEDDKRHKEALNLKNDDEACEKYLKNIQIFKVKADTNIAYRELMARSYLNAGKRMVQSSHTCNSKKNLDTAIDLYNTLCKNHIQSFNDTLKIFKRIGDAYYNRSRIFDIEGDFKKATSYATQAMKWYQKTEYCQRKVLCLNLFANINLSTFDYQKVIYYTELAKKTTENCRIRKISENEKADIFHTLGYGYKELKQYDKAQTNYQKALKHTEKTADSAKTILNIAEVNVKKENLIQAKKHLNWSLKLKNRAYNFVDNHYSYSPVYENFGDVAILEKSYEAGLKNYQLALQNLTNNFRSKDIHENPTPSDNLYVYNKLDLIRILHLKASASFKYYQQKDDIAYLVLAEKTYNAAFQFHNQLPQQINSQESRLFQAKVIVPFIENALAVAYELQQAQQKTSETAYRFMEKNKATVLMQAINEKGALRYAGLPDSVLNQEKELRENITAYEKQLNDTRQYEEKDAIKQYENLLSEQKNIYEQLIKNLENNHSKYYNLKYKQNTTTLKDVQNYLGDETALLEYFVGDSSIYILVIEKNAARLYYLDKPENWNKTLKDFRISITDETRHGDVNLFTDNAYQLYKWLLAESLNNLNPNVQHLQIIPDAQLNYLPFGLLLTETVPQNVKYQNLPYLLKDKSISYAYSVTLLLENQQQNQSKASYVYGGFAPKYNDDDLSYGRENVEAQAKKFKGKSFLADQAMTQQFKENADQFQILQLSMHGVLDDENPLYSKLEFTDHPLHAADLYNIRLNADLAILSACDTGIGEIKKGEGVMSLSRAFTYAGCPSLLMSLWSVPDNSTATIMNTFLEQLQQGKTKDKALKNAQLAYLYDEKISPENKHPIHWAGFVPSGDMQEINFKHNSCSWWWLIILLLSVILYFGNRIVRNKR